jgi:hypothetical protein
VAALDTTAYVVVDTTGIIHEVSIDSEAGLEWAECDGVLDGLLVLSADHLVVSSLVQDDWALVVAGCRALASDTVSGLVGDTLCCGNSGVLQEEHVLVKPATIATEVLLVAGDHVLLGILNTWCVLTNYATGIREWANS